MALTPKQEAFVAEYLVDLNATQAAIRAGYSEKTAYSMGQRLLKNVEVAAAIAEAQAKRAERTEITQDRVLIELAKIGFSDLRKAMTHEGALLNPGEWDDDTAGAISSLEVVVTQGNETDENGQRVPQHVHKIKTWDKLAALDKIGKHLGMFTEKLKILGDPDNPLTVNQSPNDIGRAIAFALQEGMRKGSDGS